MSHYYPSYLCLGFRIVFIFQILYSEYFMNLSLVSHTFHIPLPFHSAINFFVKVRLQM